jgi:hypothetical protein
MVGCLSPRVEATLFESSMNTPPEQPIGDDLELAPTPKSRFRLSRGRLPIVTAAAVILLLAGLGLLAFSISSGLAKPLFPNLPTFTPVADAATSEAEPIDFAELNADPAARQNQRLQVSGTFTPLDAPACLDHNGPLLKWSLVADELQLNAVGFEDILRVVSPGIEMTVTGIWRAYQGPVGCGKEPDDGTVWYLEVDRILEPNPLFGSAGPALTVIAGTQQPNLPLLDNDPTSTPDMSLTPGGTSPAAPTETIIFGAATAEVTPTPGTPIPTVATGATPIGTGTPAATGSPGASPTPGPSPTGESGTPQGTTTPGLPTGTPSGTGYPPQPTPPGGYP